MKTIGLIGGLSWKSTAEYYRIINHEVNRWLGGVHSAKILMYSFDFAEVENFNRNNDRVGLGRRIIKECKNLQDAGAELLVLCANTMHMFAPEISLSISIPLIHITDATAKSIRAAGMSRVLLLGTRYTMEGDFIKGKLENEFGIDVRIPDAADRQIINYVIYNELVIGKIRESSKQKLISVIESFPETEGVILGCTELPLIIQPSDTPRTLFNTTELHALAAVNFALA